MCSYVSNTIYNTKHCSNINDQITITFSDLDFKHVKIRLDLSINFRSMLLVVLG